MAAVIDIFTGSDETTSYRSIYVDILFFGSITGHTAGSVTVGIRPGTIFGEGSDQTKKKLVLKGTGIKFDADDKVIAGTVTTVEFTNKLGVVARLTDSIDATKLYKAFEAASFDNPTRDFEPIFDILFNRVPYLVNGSKFGDTFGFAALGDTFFGNGGDDILSGHSGNDTIHGGADDDKLFGGIGDDTIFGDAGNDLLKGDDPDLEGIGNDALDGGAGDDVFAYDGGRDVLKGGDGADILNFSFLDAADVAKPFTVDLSKGTVSQGGKVLAVRFSSIEGIVGDSSTNGDHFIGSDGDNVFVPEGFNMRIDGKGGHDRLAFYRYDELFGSATRDGPITVDAKAGIAGNTINPKNIHFTGIESFAGSSYGDTLLGGAADEEFLPMQGFDKVDGGKGVNTLSYELEVLVGNPHNPRHGVTLDLATGKAVDTENGQDTISNIRNVTGSTLDDAIAGDGLGNVLRGLAGRDTLTGRGGDDTLSGGAGADALEGDAGTDAASYADAARGVTASLAKPSGNAGDAKGDTYASVENLVGSGQDDALSGDAAKNVLAGGAGRDTLTGGKGLDTFLFDAGLDRDTITDFVAKDDTIALDAGVFAALGKAGRLAGELFKDLGVTAARQDADDRLLYNRKTGDLSYDADGKGKAAVFAHLDADAQKLFPVLTAADFLVV